jgi:hypothetical protein
MITIHLINHSSEIKIDLQKSHGDWLLSMLSKLSSHKEEITLNDLRKDFENSGLEDFELFWDNKPVNQLHKIGLLVI